MLKIKPVNKYHVEVQKLEGEIVRENARALQDKLLDIASRNNWRVILDLWDVAFIDSRGIAALLDVHNKIKEHGGTFELVDVNPQVKRVIDALLKSSVFTILPNLDKYFHAAAS